MSINPVAAFETKTLHEYKIKFKWETENFYIGTLKMQKENFENHYLCLINKPLLYDLHET